MDKIKPIYEFSPKDLPVVGGVTLDGLGLDRRLRHDPPVLV